MPKAIQEDIKKFGISGARGGKDFKSGSTELKDAKIMESVVDFGKGGLKKAKSTYNKGGVAKKKPVKKLAKGGFPDLTGDGKVTKKDVLKGRGVAMNMGGMKKVKSTYNMGGMKSSTVLKTTCMVVLLWVRKRSNRRAEGALP